MYVGVCTCVYKICNITGIEAFLITGQLWWTGLVLRMGDNRLPKAIFCSELEQGTRSHGGQQKRYKDTLKANRLEALRHCTSRAQRASTGSVRLAIALQDLSPAVWSRSCPDTGNQAGTAEDRDILERCQLPLRRLRTFLCVEDRAIVALTYTNLSLLWSEIRRHVVSTA